MALNSDTLCIYINRNLTLLDGTYLKKTSKIKKHSTGHELNYAALSVGPLSPQ
jgi:hypothetical protein